MERGTGGRLIEARVGGSRILEGRPTRLRNLNMGKGIFPLAFLPFSPTPSPSQFFALFYDDALSNDPCCFN